MVRDQIGVTPLHVAVSSNSVAVAERLLEVCQELADIVDKDGRSPLHHAVNCGDSKVKSITNIFIGSKQEIVLSQDCEYPNKACYGDFT